MADMMPKVEKLRNRFPHANIQVDGGILSLSLSLYLSLNQFYFVLSWKELMWKR